MVQVLRDLGIEYAAGNPGSSFEGLQESIINYGNPPNRMPEFITALHEESAVTMADGYGKATGKPMCAVLHGTIGVQHAAMAIYQAYYDRTPALLLAGRDLGFIAAHSANDMAGMVRSFTKWDAQPRTLAESLAAIQRAYTEAITPPCGPTLVVLDIELQKEEARDLKVPAYTAPRMTGIDASQAREIAKGLLDAQNPRIAVGRLRTPDGVKAGVQLAELVGASTSTSATQGPMSFPQRHPLSGPGRWQKCAGGSASPKRTGRISAELWRLTVNEAWILASRSGFPGGRNTQLWDHNRPYSYLGGQGAGGMGYGAPPSVGAALAAKSRGRIVINVQTDGDLNYAPGVLWTAAHHQLPMLTVMHNNRAWHQER